MIDLHGIISIAGMAGLFKVVAQTKNGVIVESLTDKKRFPAFASHKISSLEDISMFTTADDKPLAEIMKTIFDKESGAACIDSKKDDKEITAYFEAVLPEYDKERVYISNMRKLFVWYNQLQSTGNLKLKSENTDANEVAAIKKAEEKTKVPSVKRNDNNNSGKVLAGNKKTAGVRKTGVA